MVHILLSAFIDGGFTPLRMMLKSRIIYSTILQKMSEEIVSKGEDVAEHIYEFGEPDVVGVELNECILTAFLFAVATYHNYNVVYNKEVYSASFTQNVKVAVMMVLFILTKNVNSAS
jgi:hypothetical protein